MANKLPSIKPDEKLIFECETLLPKVGSLNTGHKLAGFIDTYQGACYMGNVDRVIECEKKLRILIFNARLELAKQQK